MEKSTVELKPIREENADFDSLEAAIVRLFREEIYLPLLAELRLKKSTIQNSKEDLLSAIQSGRIYFYRGKMKGKFDSTLTRELRNLGAKWDRAQGCFLIPQSQLPLDVRMAISLSEIKFRTGLERILQKMKEFVPANIADKFDSTKFFDTALFKTDKKISKSLEKITIAPKVTPAERARISAEYSKNMQLYIKDFTEKEIIKLRQDIETNAFQGDRYENLIKKIQGSYGVSRNKAKFLARQETSLLMTKYKQTRYQSAGVNEYKWSCVVGSTLHPVRPMHEALGKRSKKGETFRWDDPPVVDEKGNKKNPGQDYNCRCVAIPVVRF